MYLEYLFLEEDFNSDVEEYTYRYDVKWNGETTRILQSKLNVIQLSDSKSRIVTIKVDNFTNQEEEAKHLSIIDADFSKKHKSTLLRNDASAYYNQKLYPLANEFERQLRRFLYIKNALHTGDKVKKNIENLESKDLGEIYQLLFVDDDFCQKVRKKLNNPGIFSRNELLKEIDNFNEITTWDKIVGTDNLSVIKDKFLDIKDYRNGVMHARNITYEEFKRQKSLFEEITKELNDTINALLKHPVNKEHAEFAVESMFKGMKSVISDVQDALNALAAQILLSNMNLLFSSNKSDSIDLVDDSKNESKISDEQKETAGAVD